MSPTQDFAFTDTLTWLKGAHTVKARPARHLQPQEAERPLATTPGKVDFNPTGNPNSTGNAFADALLGNFRTYSEAQLDPIGYFRFWQLEAFVTDDWRVRRNLSVEVGVRYTYHYPTYTAGNNLTSFDPAHVRPGPGGDR